jgi:hypothetical protein
MFGMVIGSKENNFDNLGIIHCRISSCKHAGNAVAALLPPSEKTRLCRRGIS